MWLFGDWDGWRAGWMDGMGEMGLKVFIMRFLLCWLYHYVRGDRGGL